MKVDPFLSVLEHCWQICAKSIYTKVEEGTQLEIVGSYLVAITQQQYSGSFSHGYAGVTDLDQQ